jgi:hypothetical protein
MAMGLQGPQRLFGRVTEYPQLLISYIPVLTLYIRQYCFDYDTILQGVQ